MSTVFPAATGAGRASRTEAGNGRAGCKSPSYLSSGPVAGLGEPAAVLGSHSTQVHKGIHSSASPGSDFVVAAQTELRPCSLASYIAVSARRIMLSQPPCEGSNWATPAHTVNRIGSFS